MKTYYRPIVEPFAAPSLGTHKLAGGWARFSTVEVITRDGSSVVSASDVPETDLFRLTSTRDDLAGLDMNKPNIMGILNVTPDSFSDGGRFSKAADAIAQSNAMIENGAAILDIGGESTRPGAEFVAIDEEVSRTEPVIKALCDAGNPVISIDTRKAAVAQAALDAGAAIVNDVSGLCFDPELANVVAQQKVPVCIMHAQGDPKTMQKNPSYDNVLLDVYDWLKAQIDVAISKGVDRSSIILDPGIGFGKTLDHNLELLRGLSLFHGLGCPILLGASRKKFIGTISGETTADQRVSGSVAVALAGIAQGMQITRVHDVAETRQAFNLWMAMNG